MLAKFQLDNILGKIQTATAALIRYRMVIFIVAVALIYGFIFMKINGYNNEQPSEAAVTSQNKAIVSTHLDKAAASQLEQLQNNDVSVHALFVQARTNPFQDQ